MADKFTESLDKASVMLKTADHMLYMTYPLIKENRLLLKILNEIYLSMLGVINAILQYEYFNKRIQLYKDSKDNFQVFKNNCAPKYSITQEQIEKIIEIFSLEEKHKNSPFEFVRNDKVVIMSDGLRIATITVEKMKDFIFLTKDILRKAENIIRYNK